MSNQPLPLDPHTNGQILQVSAYILEHEFESLPNSLLRWHPAPSEWCMNQILGHLIQTEQPGFADRIRSMLDSTDPQLVSLDQDAEAAERGDCDRDPHELLTEFLSLRTASIDLVTSLSKTDLNRGGWHPDVGYLTVADLLHEWVYHDQDHIKQLMTNIQQFTWAHLGSTQQFYMP